MADVSGMRVVLGVEYCGAAYHGWQSQPHGETVQDVLQQAIARIAGQEVRVHAAGRTDSGVHASAQVVHFDAPVKRPLSAWQRGVNTYLPADVAVLWARDVPLSFHARFSAVARRYRYSLLNRPSRVALHYGRVGWFHAPLSLSSMQAAAEYLVGEHDFSSFRAAECQAKSPVKYLKRLNIQRVGDMIYFDLEANAFLHHMVRNIVGALIYVGKGAHSPAWLGELLAARSRELAPPTFMPDGLELCGVGYPAEFALPDPCFVAN